MNESNNLKISFCRILSVLLSTCKGFDPEINKIVPDGINPGSFLETFFTTGENNYKMLKMQE